MRPKSTNKLSDRNRILLPRTPFGNPLHERSRPKVRHSCPALHLEFEKFSRNITLLSEFAGFEKRLHIVGNQDPELFRLSMSHHNFNPEHLALTRREFLSR